MDPGTRALADYFDGWYADMAVSPVKDEIEQRHLGLPPHLLSTSLLPWRGIDDAVAALQLSSGDVLLDLACGRGGYGREIGRRTGARLLGLDLSVAALHQARHSGPEWFVAADMASLPLADDAVEAVLCVDAIQFAQPRGGALIEMRRVLRPGGRAVLTCWEPRTYGDERLPDRLRHLALQRELEDAGFTEVRVTERPDWRQTERAMWEEAAALDPGEDPALRSFRDEGVRSLASWDLLRRVVATAGAP